MRTLSLILFNETVPSGARRKGEDGFSVETAGSGKHPFSPSSDSLTDAWAPTLHKLCHNQAFCGLYDAQFLCLSTVQQQFHMWRCDDSAAGAYSQPKSWHCWSQHASARAWKVIDAYASRLITLTPPEYGAPCETLPSAHLFHR
ncbi:hypothetical protein AVEN_107752-1 [Araneus ventricosus]|uniref:Uncharacterized protein n=1 Tax=Araneus ventricosus TaxID=182803 RepID=A0A4Y2JPA5_ARAVE|nr:hypothetical protein AVEN_107752-1 [Araneus ventricosus]